MARTISGCSVSTTRAACSRFAKNAASDDEFAGATFSPDGETLYVNIQGLPAMTFAIFGPWRRR
jgi:secreted PhoX family phosphatase